ncbi:catenin alpha 1 [Echinococcus multilocularis]|uniref:Catenin alpha 1 n=1 Tax=Echinococcus multilocularis TaxID=6211 RepID=A0A068Y7K8_ECHMU|nr:catenin alpha 1 [Echinococcus multilocularis]
MAKSEGFQIACAVSVEKILEPLVEQISALIDRDDSLDRPKGLSQNKAIILDLVKNAIGDLMKNAEEIRGECPDVSANFQIALSEIQDIGEHFHKSVNAFLDNPESEEFHAEMLRALRSLLSSVTRVFILADLIDVSQLHSCLENIKGDAERIGILTDESASFCYPKLATLAANREFAVKLVNRAVDRLVCACDTTYAPATLPPLQGQAVAQLMQAVVSNVQKLSTEIAILTQSAGLGNVFQAGIARNIHELNEAVDLFIEAWDYETSAGLREYMMTMKRSCANIRSLISQAALTLSSSTFVTNNTALSHLEESAKYASEENLVSAVAEIQQQTSDLIDSALCLCGVGTDPNMMRFVRVTANDLEQLAPQLINASKALTLRSQSSLTKENFSIFLKCYKSLVQKLCNYIDEMTNVLDFLEAYDRLLQDDINSCQTNAEAAQRSGLISVSRKLSARCYRAVRYILTKLETSNGHNANANQTQTTLESIEKNLIPQLTEATREVCRNLHSRNRALQVDNVRRIGKAIRDAFNGLRPLLDTMDSRQGETSSNLAETTFNLPPPTPSLPPPLPPPQLNEYTHDSLIRDS